MSIPRKSREFVVQHHKSKNEHWDLRLQRNNRMESWVLPKGPSINPRVKRLAIRTNPHTMKYRDFEGIIDKGLYGAGKVLQWDKGTYEVLEWKPKMGIIKFKMKGKKMKGNWALIRTKRGWLLVKEQDRYVGKRELVKVKPKSVKSGKTIDKITKRDGFITEEKDLGLK